MIKNFWYAVAASNEVKKKPLGIERFGKKLVLWRDAEGKVRCTEDRCLHRRTQLSPGRVIDGEIECPFHGFRYDGAGKCTMIPANGKCAPVSKAFCIPAYSVQEDRGLIWMWWGEESKKTDQLPWFNELEDKDVPYVEVCKESTISFCRMMENNMDFSHFAFVHKRYFTADSQITYARDFKVSVTGSRLDFTGTLACDPDDPKPVTKTMDVIAAVLFPNMAKYEAALEQKYSQAVVWVTPVNEEKSWFVFRLYMPPGPFVWLRKFLKESIVLRTLWLKWVHLEDLRIWEKQEPRDGGFRDILPCSSDAMIQQYLRMYRAHQLSEKNAVPEPRGSVIAEPAEMNF